MSFAIFMLALLILLVVTGTIMIAEKFGIDLLDCLDNLAVKVAKRFGL